MATVAAPLEFVETLADLRFPQKSDALLQQLMDQNSEGKLTQAERDELEALAELSERLALLRAQALRLLGAKAGMSEAWAESISTFFHQLDDFSLFSR